jgi:Mlc titration factor MtfA (ptsG expression regulator)
MYIIMALCFLVVFYIVRNIAKGPKVNWVSPTEKFPFNWRLYLQQNVAFYVALTANERLVFEQRVQEFMLNCRITGVGTPVDDEDKLLVASSAIIPIFAFPEWRYWNLFEVLVYPKSFNEQFAFEGTDKNILGMVGTGYMDGKMILSKEALHFGFKNETDKHNTAIHEFVHLIDKMDSSIDGVPHALLEKQYAIPWMELMQKEIKQIMHNKSDINPYAATNNQEFFAVTSEYFFERPQLLEQKHPELYALLSTMFKHDVSERRLVKPKTTIGRNDACVCNSGKKFKRCCGTGYYA